MLRFWSRPAGVVGVAVDGVAVDGVAVDGVGSVASHTAASRTGNPIAAAYRVDEAVSR
jgi:hypothetical protein